VFHPALAQGDALQFNPCMGIELPIMLTDPEFDLGVEAPPSQQPMHSDRLTQATRGDRAPTSSDGSQFGKALRGQHHSFGHGHNGWVYLKTSQTSPGSGDAHKAKHAGNDRQRDGQESQRSAFRNRK